MAYTKLFSTIVTSTIWTEDANTCKVWVTMLAIANKHGEVQASIPGLAQICGLALDDVEKAVAKFLSPDKYSRTKDAEGRRIEEIDGGWSLINHAKYRRLASKEEAQEANAERQRRFKSRTNNAKVTADNAKVTADNGEVTAERDIAEAEVLRSASDADADEERREAKTTVPPNPSVVPPSGVEVLEKKSAEDERFDQFWAAYPRRQGKADARKAWRTMRKQLPELNAITDAIQNQKRSQQWTKDGGQFIPYPAVWLRGGRWADECEIEVEQAKKDKTHYFV
jgi:hypothetical protein